MVINDAAGERLYHIHLSDILREFRGHKFVSGLHTVKPEKL